MHDLLRTKFYPPTMPSRRVIRTRLVDRLNEGLEFGRSLTLVSAPAGFGKSTCIREWMEGLSRPFAWLSLDPEDDAPARFFIYLIAALQAILPNMGGEIEGLVRSGSLPSTNSLNTALVNNLLQAKKPFLLVLDDFHLIQDPIILEVIEKLLNNPPPPMHLVLITREDPPLPLARLRARNQITEIRAADLRFSGQETGRFLNEVMGLDLSVEDVARLEARTEGWAAGLQLAVLSLKGRDNPSYFIKNLSGNQRYVLGYLTEEVLNRQDEAIREFLLQTSVLDRLCGDLCNAVTGRTNSQSVLARLLNANLFIIPLDDDGRWYRYHHLFAGLLRERLSTSSPIDSTELHRRAARWYAQTAEKTSKGHISPQKPHSLSHPIPVVNAAIHHALIAEDYELAVQLLENYALEMIAQGYVKTGEGWLQAIPAEFSVRSPKANLAFAWMHVVLGMIPQSVPYVERLEEIFSKGMDDPSLTAQWLALQAYLRFTDGDLSQTLDLASQALEVAPEDDDYLRSLAYNALGMAYLMVNDYARTVEVYQKAIAHGRRAGNYAQEQMGISVLTQIASQHGQLHFTYQIATQGLERVRLPGSPPSVVAVIYGALGQVEYQWNQIEQARSHLSDAIQVCYQEGYADGEALLRSYLARLLYREGDLEEANREIDRAMHMVRAGVADWVRPEILAQWVRINLAQGNITGAELALVQSGLTQPSKVIHTALSPDIPYSYPSGLMANSALRVLLNQARARTGPVDLKAGYDLANHLVEKALQNQYQGIALEALLLQAQIADAIQDGEMRQDNLVKALELAESEGYISVFLEEGQPIADALEAILQQKQFASVSPDTIRKILAAFHEIGIAPTPTRLEKGSGMVVPLTSRELQVLQLIAAGDSNQEIADRLFITVRTVKKHTGNIFAKLNATSRTQAAAKARELGLLLD